MSESNGKFVRGTDGPGGLSRIKNMGGLRICFIGCSAHESCKEYGYCGVKCIRVARGLPLINTDSSCHGSQSKNVCSSETPSRASLKSGREDDVGRVRCNVRSKCPAMGIQTEDVSLFKTEGLDSFAAFAFLVHYSQNSAEVGPLKVALQAVLNRELRVPELARYSRLANDLGMDNDN